MPLEWLAGAPHRARSAFGIHSTTSSEDSRHVVASAIVRSRTQSGVRMRQDPDPSSERFQPASDYLVVPAQEIVDDLRSLLLTYSASNSLSPRLAHHRARRRRDETNSFMVRL
jgi:hypothetical protein